jgi:PHD/YefM family antitoxin component YafN of YafNO toxin-antitoxin module
MIEKHGRGVVVVISVEEYERLLDTLARDRQGGPQITLTLQTTPSRP